MDAMLKKRQLITYFILTELLLLSFFIVSISGVWARTMYPMDKTSLVYFVLSTSMEGGDSNTGMAILKGFIFPAFIAFIVLNALFFLIYSIILHRSFLAFNAKRVCKYTALAFLLLAIYEVVVFKAWEYPYLFYAVNKKPASSSFYKAEYKSPKTVSITAPEERQNLILIFLESMETSYFSVENGGVFPITPIPNLERLALTNLTFCEKDAVKGSYNLPGTSWTIAGLLSKTSGLPYFNPFIKEDGSLYCLRSAVTLFDILKEEGYTSLFSMGSKKEFENRAAYFSSHNVTVHDIEYYKDEGLIPEEYKVFWGFEDERLYDIARKELKILAKKDSPFCYGLITTDTHFPKGYKCSLCPNTYEEQMMNVLSCADKQVDAFVTWIKEQEWGEKTTIVITGDHAYLNSPLDNFVARQSAFPADKVEKRRRVYFTVINPLLKKKDTLDKEAVNENLLKDRVYSSYDLFPTILETLGYKIQGGRLAFGSSLLSGERTLLEKYSPDEISAALMTRCLEYENLK